MRLSYIGEVILASAAEAVLGFFRFDRTAYSNLKGNNDGTRSKWMWLQRNAINNNTFKNEQEIGKVVSDWRENYNHTHIKTITDTLHNELTNLFT